MRRAAAAVLVLASTVGCTTLRHYTASAEDERAATESLYAGHCPGSKFPDPPAWCKALFAAREKALADIQAATAVLSAGGDSDDLRDVLKQDIETLKKLKRMADAGLDAAAGAGGSSSEKTR